MSPVYRLTNTYILNPGNSNRRDVQSMWIYCYETCSHFTLLTVSYLFYTPLAIFQFRFASLLSIRPFRFNIFRFPLILSYLLVSAVTVTRSLQSWQKLEFSLKSIVQEVRLVIKGQQRTAM